MKQLYDQISNQSSKMITRKYSTSFSLGIYYLDRKIHTPIYSIYGFVRLADEIVDSFHGYDKAGLLKKFREDTVLAIEDKISLNPVLHSFQTVYHKYDIEWELVDLFLTSMEMDLNHTEYSAKQYDDYILGSAEVVGLMCLRVFTENDHELYQKLKPYAMKLGSAFQKVNFLRDVKADFEALGRTYFPSVDMENFSDTDKAKIELEISNEFDEALIGIKLLPENSRKGVYLAYYYYKELFLKIKKLPSHRVMNSRIRIHNVQKFALLLQSTVRLKLNSL
jgi:phytoene/squalene synthetase